MGGDQIYFDSIWEDIKALRQWVALPRQAQLEFKVTKELEREIEAYYFGLYKQRWLPGERKPWSSPTAALDARSEVLRVGKECVSRCSSGCVTYHLQNK